MDKIKKLEKVEAILADENLFAKYIEEMENKTSRAVDFSKQILAKVEKKKENIYNLAIYKKKYSLLDFAKIAVFATVITTFSMAVTGDIYASQSKKIVVEENNSYHKLNEKFKEKMFEMNKIFKDKWRV